jgi:hypothetical protein
LQSQLIAKFAVTVVSVGVWTSRGPFEASRTNRWDIETDRDVGQTGHVVAVASHCVSPDGSGNGNGDGDDDVSIRNKHHWTICAFILMTYDA